MTYCSKYAPHIDTAVIANDYEWKYWSTSYGNHAAQILNQRWYSSAKTSQFRSLKKRDLPVNRFTGGAEVFTYKPGYASRYYQGAPQIWRGVAPIFFPAMSANLGYGFSISDSAAVAAIAQNNALSKCANMKINIAQSFAERKQTANLLIHSVNRFVSFATLFRKGRFAAANAALGRKYFSNGKKFPRDTLKPPDRNTFANLWLEYSYGWRPLLNDVYGAAELLAQTHTKTRPTKVSGHATDVYPYSKQTTLYGVTARLDGVMSKMARCQLYFDVASYEADMLKSTGISNPALLAWELLPYSFVVDWFLPVGNYLNNVNAASGLRFLKGALSVKTTWRGTSKHMGNIHNYAISGFDCIEEGAILDRFALTSFPSAQLPSFRYGLNTSQALSGIALLSQLFRR